MTGQEQATPEPRQQQALTILVVRATGDLGASCASRPPAGGTVRGLVRDAAGSRLVNAELFSRRLVTPIRLRAVP